MKKSSEQDGRFYHSKQGLKKWIALIIVAMICLGACNAQAVVSYEAAPDGTAPELVLPEDASFGGSLSDLGMPELTKSNFDAEDLPEHYQTPAENPGRVIEIAYTTYNNVTAADLFMPPNAGFRMTAGDEKVVKHVMVYLPAGYDESEKRYPILYLLHGSTSSPLRYLNPEEPTILQNILDHMIEDARIEPMIVVAATYYPEDEMVKNLPLAMKVQLVRSFPDEMVNDIIPQVEKKVRTYAASTSKADIAASREYRAIAGFSLGGVATWYTFQQQMQAFKWFVPISEAGWDDGEGGLSGILDSDVSAQAIYDSVKEQGFGAEDFMLFVATGSDDEAFQVTTNQMISLLEYDDMFIVGTNTSCSLMSNGTHTIDALYTYAYQILPSLFAEAPSQPGGYSAME